MSSPLFERVCDELETRTGLSLLEARGTLRIALKQAGLDPNQVNRNQMMVVLAKVMPHELLTRGIEDGHAVCRALEDAVKSAGGGAETDAGERIDGLFRRTL